MNQFLKKEEKVITESIISVANAKYDFKEEVKVKVHANGIEIPCRLFSQPGILTYTGWMYNVIIDDGTIRGLHMCNVPESAITLI